jgi:hypothetical protein
MARVGSIRIGVISDTHGLLRNEALQALAGSELIIHAGDVGRADILTALGELAPVIAVRGNVDSGAFSEALPKSAVAEAGGLRMYVVHNVADLDFEPSKRGFGVVIFGHSHKPSRTKLDQTLFLNPGSAGPQRFRLPVTLARLSVDKGSYEVSFTDLLSGHPFEP